MNNDEQAVQAIDDVRESLRMALVDVMWVIGPLGVLQALRDACGEDEGYTVGVIEGAIQFLGRREG